MSILGIHVDIYLFVLQVYVIMVNMRRLGRTAAGFGTAQYVQLAPPKDSGIGWFVDFELYRVCIRKSMPLVRSHHALPNAHAIQLIHPAYALSVT